MPSYENKFVGLVTKIGGWDKSAEIASRSVAQLKRYAKGDDAPLSVIKALTSAAGISLDWLIFDNENPFISNDKDASKGMVNLPIMSVMASAGNGRTVAHEQQSGVVAVDEVMVRSMGLNPRKLFVTGSNGESMFPTINSGDYLIVSNDEQDLAPGDGIYFIRLEGDVLVKRLQRLPGQKIKVSSDNKAYEPYVIEINDGIDFQILGKVKLRINIERV